jgi:hypothetical protein
LEQAVQGLGQYTNAKTKNKNYLFLWKKS